MSRFLDSGEMPQLTTLTPEEQRIADLEYRLAQQEYQIQRVGYLVKRLYAALKALEAEEERSSEQTEYITKLHQTIARLGVRGEAVFTKDHHLMLRVLIAEEVIVTARVGLRDMLGYHFAKMQEDIKRSIAARPPKETP